MPGHSYSHRMVADPNVERNRIGVSNRRASGIPLPRQSEQFERELSNGNVPGPIGNLWGSQNQYNLYNGQAQFNAGPARVPTSAHFSTSGNVFHNGPTDSMSGLHQSPPMITNGPGHFEARGRYPSRSIQTTNNPISRSIQISSYPRIAYSPPSVGVRQSFGQTRANTSRTDGVPLRLRSSFASESSAMNPVDFKELDYVDAVDQNLVCPICQCPMVEPVETECGHTFCSQCLCSAMDHQFDEKTCPSCRKSLYVVKIDPVSSIVDHTSCQQLLQRRQATDEHCHHRAAICDHCPEVMPELELEEHMKMSCEHRAVICRECYLEIRMDEVDQHKSVCPEAIVQCDAAPYGCIFESKRDGVAAHAIVCPIYMLLPHLEAQKNRFKEHEDVLERLQRQNNIYREFMTTVEDDLARLARLAPSPMPGVPSYHGLSQPAHSPFEGANHQPTSHLLALHEPLREDVARLRNAISEVDARANATSINDNLRHAEEMSRVNASLSTLRTQFQYLITSQHQRAEQRALRVRNSRGSRELLPEPDEGTSTNPDGGGVGVDSIRRPSDPNRQDPKL
ncbi:hypothetical protein MMC11_004962 [Xylographa trunciseda]|nr:hypothetical protein [Xylographa trunciseda]